MCDLVCALCVCVCATTNGGDGGGGEPRYLSVSPPLDEPCDSQIIITLLLFGEMVCCVLGVGEWPLTPSWASGLLR